MLKHSTRTAPSATSFTCRQSKQHGDSCRAGDQPAREAEQDDLAGGDVAVAEALADVVGMRALMGILVALQRQLQPLQLSE